MLLQELANQHHISRRLASRDDQPAIGRPGETVDVLAVKAGDLRGFPAIDGQVPEIADAAHFAAAGDGRARGVPGEAFPLAVRRQRNRPGWLPARLLRFLVFPQRPQYILLLRMC